MIVIATFAVAFAVRLLHVWQIRRAPFFDLKLGDAAAYDAWARQIAAGDWVGHEVFYQAPLYPYVLALVYRTIGSSTLAVRLFQAVLSAASCALLADTARRLFSIRTGIAAGLMLAFYPPAIFLDTLLQKSALDLFLLCAVLWLISRMLAAPRRSITWQLGLVVGCLTLTRENAAILVIPILLWLMVQRPAAVRDRLVCAALFLSGLAIVLLPVAARNAAVGHEFFLTTSQFGPNLYIGNNERSDGTYKPLRPFREKPAFEQQDATELAEQALGRRLTPAEVSSFYTRRVMAFIRERPGQWVELLARKFVLLWNATEISDTEDQYTSARWSWPVALGSVWHLGVLAPLAVLGIWITMPDRRRLWILYLMLAMYAATVVLFYVFARYRFPMVPILVLFAAAGAVRIPDLLAFRPLRTLGCVAAVTSTAVFCNLPLVPIAKLEAATHYNDGVGLEAIGRADAALEEYRAALQLDSGLAVAHTRLGLLLAGQGRLAEAADELQQSAQLSPDDAYSRNNLGVILGREGRSLEALSEVEAAIRLDPGYAEARRNRAALLPRAGRLEEAIDEYNRAIRLNPRDVTSLDDLSALLARAGRLDEAISVLRRAQDITPGDPHLRNGLASLLARSGRLDEAAAELRSVIAIAPDRADAHNNLGIVLAQGGDLAAAVAEFERALALNPDDVQTRRNLERIRARR